MSSNASLFKTTLQLEVSNKNEKLYKVLKDLIYVDEIVGEIIVPVGFITDLDSTPRIPVVYSIAGDIGKYAACLHDYLYTQAKFPREVCDATYRRALIATGISKALAQIMYLGVRSFGANHYGTK